MNADPIHEPCKTLLLAGVLAILSATAHAQTGSQDPSPLQPVVNVIASDAEGTEIPQVPPGMGMPQRFDPAVFTIWRDGPTNVALNVFYSLGGSASNGVDYAKLPGMVTIPEGSKVAHIQVAPIDDLLPEGTERVVIEIQPVDCIAVYPPPPDCYLVGPSNRAGAVILDNDFLTNQPPRVRMVRPEDGQMFSAPTHVTMVVETFDVDGYVGRVEFFANTNKIGQSEKQFLVAPLPGTMIRHEFVWTNPPAGRHVLRARATDDQQLSNWSEPIAIWVVTNPPPPATNLPLVSIVAVDPIASEGTNCLRWEGWTNPSGLPVINTARFLVRRIGSTNEALTVHYHIGGTASNGVDYLTLPGAVTIPAGARSAPIHVVPINDPLPERVETVVLGIRQPPDATSVLPDYYVGHPRHAAAIIVDDDQPRPRTGLLEDRCFHLALPALNGTWVRIESSDDAMHWVTLCTMKVTDGAIHFVDPDGDEQSQRFYRAVPESNPPEQ